MVPNPHEQRQLSRSHPLPHHHCSPQTTPPTLFLQFSHMKSSDPPQTNSTRNVKSGMAGSDCLSRSAFHDATAFCKAFSNKCFCNKILIISYTESSLPEGLISNGRGRDVEDGVGRWVLT
ncbi:hypothetical protein COP2_000434 [Malus domestica]